MGLPPIGGRTGAKQVWDEVLKDSDDAQRAFEVLKSVSKQFDNEFGTNLLNAVLREM